MLRSPLQNKKRSERGLASIESIVLSFVFVILTSFGLGFFGIIHTGIVNSISARQYAFDTFQNRTHLIYHRDHPARIQPGGNSSYRRFGFRLHSITAEGNDEDVFVASARNIAVTPAFNKIEGKQYSTHADLSRLPASATPRRGINPVWVKAAYGICLDATCGSLQ